jgi:hypothetical protein
MSSDDRCLRIFSGLAEEAGLKNYWKLNKKINESKNYSYDY